EFKNSSGLTIDAVQYDDSSPWPTEPDGNGPSLILCNPNADNNLGTNWSYSQNFVTNNNDGNPIYATPGFSECGFPPVAAFTADQTEIFIGESISFTDLSTNNPASWLWTFEGGTPATSSDQNPIITYNSAGIFDVSLSVSNPGGTDEAFAIDYITITEETTGVLMITEIMQNPSDVNDSEGEWFEVFNPTNSPINMFGWYIKDNDVDSIKILSSLLVPANGFVTLGLKSDPGINGNYVCDYEYSNFFIANAADEIILFNPDEEEIDRVEYDGGPNWPDPNGASMIFTGSKDDDNNNHQNWDVAGIRELSYFGTTYADLGSPGTNGTGQNLVIPGFEVELKVYFEGPFNGINMNTELNSNLVIPLSQPFNIAPWNYTGSESVVSIPNANVVDWVLVELRDAPEAASATSGTMIEQQAAFLLSDGSIVGLNGLSLLSFNHSIIQSLFVVIWHRNHLGIISHYPLTETAGIYSYDFTTLADQVLGNLTGYKEIVSGIYGMVGGDGNADGIIGSSDKLSIWEEQTGASGYIMGDFNLDGQVTNQDKNDIWINNAAKNDQVPD
ncbi:MAG: lamin tail domain-containing protein, partial [Bacteroidales bacterium]|nr:lamin tail domain-containing protein [Bacteroidales bacterium]